LATTWYPVGTVIRNVYDARSVGWSLTGNHAVAASGSPATIAPSAVRMNPDTASMLGMRKPLGNPS
jgi:hypothetical protein